MGKNLMKRNLLTVYVREEYKETVGKFQELIKKDPRLQELRYKDKDGLTSIAILQLMLKYVTEQEAKQ